MLKACKVLMLQYASLYSNPVSEPSPPRTTGIQDALRAPRASAFQKYQDLGVGTRSWTRLLLYELVVTFTSGVPGALGLLLRRIAYPWVLGAVGRNVTFGQGVVLRHPGKIRIGDGVTIDDLVVLDAKGETNRGIVIGNGVFLGRATILSCKNGDITLGDEVNIGFHSEIFSGSTVTVGRYGLFAAYTYVVGGGHEFSRLDQPVLHQPRTSVGVTLGENVWLGTGAKVMDGVTIGRDVVVGAGAVVTENLPDATIAVGIPARVVKRRDEPASAGTKA
jgi:acetyltransferase-like isoleucine patch superfamily enzyme